MNLQIVDQYGRVVRAFSKEYGQGSHQLIIAREDLVAGLYYYTISANEETVTKRMLIIE